PMAALHYGAQAAGAAPPALGHAYARHATRSVAVSRRLAGGQLGVAGRTATGQAHGAQPGVATGRTAVANPASTERDGAAGSRDIGAAALRAVEQPGDGAGPWYQRVGSQHPLHPRAAPAQGHAAMRPRLARRHRQKAEVID